jgi:hypothetical protein
MTTCSVSEIEPPSPNPTPLEHVKVCKFCSLTLCILMYLDNVISLLKMKTFLIMKFTVDGYELWNVIPTFNSLWKGCLILCATFAMLLFPLIVLQVKLFYTCVLLQKCQKTCILYLSLYSEHTTLFWVTELPRAE